MKPEVGVSVLKPLKTEELSSHVTPLGLTLSSFPASLYSPVSLLLPPSRTAQSAGAEPTQPIVNREKSISNIKDFKSKWLLEGMIAGIAGQPGLSLAVG